MSDFEQIPEIAERIKRSKMELQDNGNYWAPEWDSQSCCDQDFVNNFKKGWQHQQAKINQHQLEIHALGEANLNQAMMLAKKQEEIDDLKAQLNNMEACYIEKKKQVDACAALAAGWSAITLDKTTHWTEGYEEGCYHCSGQIEEALRGAND